ncbi:Glu-tRNA(Gln) amidotransferase subunit GatD [Candidatus Pacearchaeota archaeon]|nr:Glu-tRNA(Gln) amidotransferase subunit GatD [Candidatus Pacearchaeota archaeon]
MAELNFNPGDQVKLRLAMDELEGTVLENFDSSFVLLKLKSGYNIGIPKENILGSKIIRKFKEEDIDPEVPPLKSGSKSIGLIITGGTIASKLDSRTGGVRPLVNPAELARFYPELFSKVNVKKVVVPFMIFSEAMNSEHWVTLAKTTKEMLDDPEIQGVIITHGTDTLHYTAAALSFFLRGLTKPVVLTYSQKSVDRASSDAHLNLQCAAQMATSDAAEVMLVGHASTNDDFCYALRGTKVRKLHSSRRDAFKPVNITALAKVYPDRIEFLSSYKKKNTGKTELDVSFSDKVALVKFYPGQDPSILDFYALKYKGIIIEAAGLGHLPPSDAGNSWIPSLKKHIRNGLVVCVAAQTIFGRVDPYVYSTGRELLDAGVIFLEDMLAETALVKLGWVLGHYGWKKNVKEKMLENFSEELNDRLTL